VPVETVTRAADRSGRLSQLNAILAAGGLTPQPSETSRAGISDYNPRRHRRA
jgi:hypothetical protein